MTKQDEGRIYVITHKPAELKLPPGYTRLFVGAEKLENKDRQDLKAYTFDDTGDHISDKNKSYCELTGLYWIWKNQNSRIVGIEHYRRFFQPGNDLPSVSAFERMLDKADIIVPKRQWVEKNARVQFERFHRPEDLRLAERVIDEHYPEYREAFSLAMSKCYLFSFNMMVCRKELFDAYCEWLFGILGEIEARIDTTGFDAYQNRIYGFLSERLLLVYLLKHGLRIREVRVNETEIDRATRWESRKWQMLTICKNIISGRGFASLKYPRGEKPGKTG